jgi:hypothetical protein
MKAFGLKLFKGPEYWEPAKIKMKLPSKFCE